MPHCSRITRSALLSLWLTACESPTPGVTSPLPPTLSASATHGEPFTNLTAAESDRFIAGKDEFEEVEAIDAGLGPIFNDASCATCHDEPVGGTTGRKETRFGRVLNGAFDPMFELGGSLIQDRGIESFTGEVVPAGATVSAQRITTPLFGLGLVDAVPDEELRQLAQLEAATSPATAGTPSMTREIRTGRTRVGRFGWKAQVPTLHQFSGDAYLNEMGITNPEFPDENCPQGDCAALAHNPVPGLNNDGKAVAAFTDFMTLLAPPARSRTSSLVYEGSGVFVRVGCADCHTPVLVTGPSPVDALSHRVFRPFSDFLLHDMGSLGDSIVQGSATGSQMRTAPLWGVRTRTALLHDGRAATIDAAIRAHDGQGRLARDLFLGLGSRARVALLAFVNSL